MYQMSAPAAAVKATRKVARRAVTSFGRTPRFNRGLRKDPVSGLPRPPVNIIVRDIAPCRLADHYYTTLQDDLMYMTYKHELGPRPPKRQIRLMYDPEDPYTKNRANHPVGGSQMGKQPPPPSTPENTVRLEMVQIHTQFRDATSSRSNLLGAIMALRALSGESFQAGGRHANEGIQITKGKKVEGKWGVRPGIPMGVKVTLKGPSMYDFIGTLVEFVLPRLREFPGLVLPPPSSSANSPSAVTGVVSFGLNPTAMALFPQCEVNIDSYPKPYGMHIHFITNATGIGAQNRARALVSGFQIPFIRK